MSAHSVICVRNAKKVKVGVEKPEGEKEEIETSGGGPFVTKTYKKQTLSLILARCKVYLLQWHLGSKHL